MNSEIINRLIELVMNERQAKIYYAILQYDHSTASELHRLSGIPLSKTYDTLKYLSVNGFCIKRSDETNKITYSSTDPKISIKKVIEQKKKEQLDTQELMADLNEMYLSAPIQGDLSEYIEVIHGNQNVHKKFIELMKNTQHKILSILCPPFAMNTETQRIEQKKASDAFSKRGGKVISIREANENTAGFIFESIRTTLTLDKTENNRITKKSPIKLLIFDNETLMTFNNTFVGTGEDICASIIKQPNSVATYIHMFNYLFEQAELSESWVANNQELYNRKLKEFDDQ